MAIKSVEEMVKWLWGMTFSNIFQSWWEQNRRSRFCLLLDVFVSFIMRNEKRVYKFCALFLLLAN